MSVRQIYLILGSALLGLALLLCPDAAAQQVKFDAANLKVLLKSSDIGKIRQAHAMLAAHPQESKAFLEIVAGRVGHPEFRRILQVMLERASEQECRDLLSKSQPSQRQIILKLLRGQPGDTARHRVPTTPETDHSSTPKESHYSVSQLKIKVNSRKQLTVAELEYLILALDEHTNPKDIESFRRMNEIKNLLYSNRSASPYVLARFLDRSVRHPERLISYLPTSNRVDPRVESRLWELTESSHPNTIARAVSGIGSLRRRSQSRQEKEAVITKLLQISSEDQLVRSACVRVSAKLLEHASPPVQIEVGRYAIKTLLNWRAQGYRSSDISIQSACIVSELSEADQKELQRMLASKLNAAPSPAQSVRFLLASGWELQAFTADFQLLFDQCEDIRGELLFGQAVYRSSGDKGPLVQTIDDAMSTPEFKTYLKEYVIEAIAVLGAEAKQFLPRLVTLIETRVKGYREVIVAVGKMGSAGHEAIPVLIDILQSPSPDRGSDHRSAMQALANFGVNAKAALPEILRIIESGDMTLRRSAIGAVAKIAGNDPALTRSLAQLASEQESYGIRWQLGRVVEGMRKANGKASRAQHVFTITGATLRIWKRGCCGRRTAVHQVS